MEQNREEDLSDPELIDSLKELVLREDVSEKLCRSLLPHLADLKMLIPLEDGGWKIASSFSNSKENPGWVDALKKLCSQPEGFALKYFVRDLPSSVSLEWSEPRGGGGSISDDLLEGEGRSVPKKSSNLSNLQIVKKVGRQLSPLIEMENYFLEKLQGPRTSRQDARILFNFIIGRIKIKGEPREWTQLSRRRHK